MGQADHARHHVQAASTSTSIMPTRELTRTRWPSCSRDWPGHRVHQQLMTRLAFHQPMEVVHPRIVAAHMATADQQQLIGSRAAMPQSAQVGEDTAGAA
jgi:hypothetical protein